MAATVCLASTASIASAQPQTYYPPAQQQPVIVYQAEQQPAPMVQVVEAPPPMGRVHDGGFFGRLQLGGAFSYTTYEDVDLTWSGPAVEGTISLGLSLPNALALHVDFLAASTMGLTVKFGGSSVAVDDVSYTTYGFGLGGTYYLPSNAFFTGGVGAAIADLTDADGTVTAESDVGVYLTLGAGREWWVARRFGLGLYARVSVFALPDTDTDSRFTTFVPSLGLSMTVD